VPNTERNTKHNKTILLRWEYDRKNRNAT
jgi:hypothetical protein